MDKAHIVMSITNGESGIDIQEDVAGTIPQLSTLITMYLVHFCQHFSKVEATSDGHKFSAKTILTGIMIASMHNIEEELPEDLQ